MKFCIDIDDELARTICLNWGYTEIDDIINSMSQLILFSLQKEAENSVRNFLLIQAQEQINIAIPELLNNKFTVTELIEE